MAKSKPTVLLIVEGTSDKTALEKIFKKLYKFKEINFEVTEGDITSDKSTTIYNVEDNHALYNEQNLPEDLKQEYADLFYETFKDAPRTFIEFLKEEVVNEVPNSYPQSWRYIKEELHSLERHTNLNIYFDKNPIDFLL